ncbi:MAG: hypothetical protein JSW11_11275 [Candidatus Heimdallarchaeota archaeon]|nr:MAG: hypothetical protein JSW11_11275 [Candidatus Heimdallarchaeota archaeon]
MGKLGMFLNDFFIGIWLSVRNCFIVFKYETKRYLLSNRILFLLVFCFVPTLLYVSYAGQTASLEIYLHKNGYEWFASHVLQIFVTFAYIINILVSIVVIQELFLHESAIEILLSSTKRFELFAGKSATAVIVLIVTSLFTWIACVLAFFMWQQDLPISPDQFTLAFLILIIVSLVPLAVTILGNTMVMKFRSLSGLSSGFPIFVFFVIPFFIFSSVFLGFATEDILEFSTYFRVFFITNFFLMTEDERIATGIDVNNALTFFGIIVVLSISFAWLFFWTMETRKKE